MLSMISGIIVMIMTMSLMYAASVSFRRKREVWVPQALVCGIACGVVTALSPKVSPWIAMFFLIAILGMMGHIIAWWKPNGSTWKEVFIVSLLDLMVMLTGQSAAARILDITSIRVIVGAVKVLPIMMFIISVGYFIANRFAFKDWLYSDECKEWLCSDEYPNNCPYGDLGDLEVGELGESLFSKIRRWVYDQEDKTSLAGIYLDNTGIDGTNY